MPNENLISPSPENMKNVVIIRASSEDAKAIAEIQKDGWLNTYVSKEYGITEEDILAKDFGGKEHVSRWTEGINKPGTATFVAKEDNEPVGFCFIREGDEYNQIGALYVLSTVRGKGIGTKLMQQALAHLGNKKPIHLEVVSFNENAISFYESFGFERQELIEKPTSGVLPSGAQIPEIKMVLDADDTGL